MQNNHNVPAINEMKIQVIHHIIKRVWSSYNNNIFTQWKYQLLWQVRIMYLQQNIHTCDCLCYDAGKLPVHYNNFFNPSSDWPMLCSCFYFHIITQSILIRNQCLCTSGSQKGESNLYYKGMLCMYRNDLADVIERIQP